MKEPKYMVTKLWVWNVFWMLMLLSAQNLLTFAASIVILITSNATEAKTWTQWIEGTAYPEENK